MSDDNAPTTIKRPRRRRWLVLAAAVVGLAVFHAPLLRGIGAWLCVDDGARNTDYVVLLPSKSGDDSVARTVAGQIHDGAVRGVLFFAMPPTRGEQCGALPSFETVFRRQLSASGVPDAQIICVPGPSRNSWEAARALGTWLGQNPDVRVAVLCPEFRGRYERHVLRAQIDLRDLSRVTFATPITADEGNWWTSREMIQTVFQNYVRLAFVSLNGETNPDAQPWSYDEYLRKLPPAEPVGNALGGIPDQRANRNGTGAIPSGEKDNH
jgi:hypothetical protein